VRRDRVVSRVPAAALLASIVGAACSGAPSLGTGSNVDVGQTVMEMGEAVNALQAETALLQWQVDSLGAVVARQDTVIRQLAGMAGVPVPVR
jgi:hypothetical protein